MVSSGISDVAIASVHIEKTRLEEVDDDDDDDNNNYYYYE